jgi:putative redox protein
MRAVVAAGHFDIVSDEPTSAGGDDTGPTPTDLFLASLASCFALALAWAAQRAGTELPGLEVHVTGTYDGPRFSEIELEVGTRASADVVDGLLPEAERVCYVTNSLRHPPRLRFRTCPTPPPGTDGERGTGREASP